RLGDTWKPPPPHAVEVGRVLRVSLQHAFFHHTLYHEQYYDSERPRDIEGRIGAQQKSGQGDEDPRINRMTHEPIGAGAYDAPVSGRYLVKDVAVWLESKRRGGQ